MVTRIGRERYNERVDKVRAPAVAGTFYPASPTELSATVDRLLAAVSVPANAPCPKALIVPHAGYMYSGPVAASAFALVKPHAERIKRIVLVGPAHRVYVEGLVSPGATRLRTPLGELVVDAAAHDFTANPSAHAREHSLEVELPFLQRVAPHATVVPLAGTRAVPDVVGAALDKLWGGPETLIVISSDLSHFLPYAEARRVDEQTCARIRALDPSIDGERACGSIGVNGLLWLAKRKRLRIELLDLRNSGDTAGSRDEVVGYAAFALYEGV
jgi:AmmeMemoRadiSam system protein B